MFFQAIFKPTGCPNKFGMFANESKYVNEKKMYFAPKYCFLSLFCQLQKWNWIFKQFFSNLKQFTK